MSMSPATRRPMRGLPSVPVGDCILWFAGVGWNSICGTDRRLIQAMREPVVWVDAAPSPLRPGGRWLPAHQGGVEMIRDEPLLVRVTTGTPPFSSRVGVRSTASIIKRLQVRTVLNRLGAHPRTVVSSYLDGARHPWGEDAVEVLLGTDDFVAGADLMGLSAKWLKRLERRSLRRADVVVAVTDGLADKWRALGADPRVLRNGCEPVPKSDLRTYPCADPSNTAPRRPVAGLVGQFSARINLDVLERLATSEVELLLVGPVDPGWERERFRLLIERDSVHYVGPVPAEVVPQYLAQMDVGLTPYVNSQFNRASFPLKTMEYLGAGIPVVTSRLPASEWVAADLGPERSSRHIALADHPTDFVTEVQRLSRLRSKELDDERWRYATRHSWASRAVELLSIVAEARR